MQKLLANKFVFLHSARRFFAIRSHVHPASQFFASFAQKTLLVQFFLRRRRLDDPRESLHVANAARLREALPDLEVGFAVEAGRVDVADAEGLARAEDDGVGGHQVVFGHLDDVPALDVLPLDAFKLALKDCGPAFVDIRVRFSETKTR